MGFVTLKHPRFVKQSSLAHLVAGVMLMQVPGGRGQGGGRVPEGQRWAGDERRSGESREARHEARRRPRVTIQRSCDEGSCTQARRLSPRAPNFSLLDDPGRAASLASGSSAPALGIKLHPRLLHLRLHPLPHSSTRSFSLTVQTMHLFTLVILSFHLCERAEPNPR